MVFIPLRGQITNLLVTFSTILAELGALSVALTLNRVLETRVLEKRKSVFLFRHCLRMKLITMLIMISFVAVEVFFSVTSGTAFKEIMSPEPCVSIVPIGDDRHNEPERENEVQAISFKCMHVSGTTISQHMGNFSLLSQNVSCSEDPLYSYNNTFRVIRSPSKAKKRCREVDFVLVGLRNGEPAQPDVDLSSMCIYFEYEHNRLYLSDALHSDELTDMIEFSETTLYFDASSMVLDIADNLFDQFLSKNNVEELHIRRMLFTSNMERVCEFTTGKTEGTDVPAYVIVILGSLWFLLIAAYVVSLIASRKLLLTDLSDPFLWAYNISHLEVGSRKKALIEVREENGQVTVSNFNHSMKP